MKEEKIKHLDKNLDAEIFSLMHTYFSTVHGYSDQFIDQCLGDATYFIQDNWDDLKKLMKKHRKGTKNANLKA